MPPIKAGLGRSVWDEADGIGQGGVVGVKVDVCEHPHTAPTLTPTSAADVGLRPTQHRHCLRLQSSVGLLLNTVSQFGLVRAVNNKSGRHCTNTLVIDSTYLYCVFGLLIMKTIMSLNR